MYLTTSFIYSFMFIKFVIFIGKNNIDLVRHYNPYDIISLSFFRKA